MASSLRSFAAALLFVMLFMATELGRNTILVAEAGKCEVPSGKFKGLCGRSKTCRSICRTEGFPDGQCRGIRFRCMCIKNC